MTEQEIEDACWKEIKTYPYIAGESGDGYNESEVYRAWKAGYQRAVEEYKADAELWLQLRDMVEQITRPLMNAEGYHLSVGEKVTEFVDQYWEEVRNKESNG